MLFSIITLFPEMFEGTFDHSIIKRAKRNNLIDLNFVNLRDFGIGKHKVVDDKPFGGGVGMVLRVDVLLKAILSAKKKKRKAKVILLDPRGQVYDQNKAEKLVKYEHIILICGHYEGVDERIRDYIDDEISIGDYILSGGEIPAMIIIDSVTRLIPNVLKKEEATQLESFSNIICGQAGIEKKRILEYPQYTRPRTYKGKSVPEILLSGNKKKIEQFKLNQAIKITSEKRPDILKRSE